MMTTIDPTLPPVVQEYLRSGRALESIRLHDDGHWTHEGLLIENQKLIDLFARSIGRTDGGTWVLEIGPFTYPIEIDRTPYFIRRIDDLDGPTPTIQLTDRTSEPLDPDTIAYEDPGVLTCAVKQGAYRARFLRSPYYAIAERARDQDGTLKVSIAGRTIALGPAAA